MGNISIKFSTDLENNEPNNENKNKNKNKNKICKYKFYNFMTRTVFPVSTFMTGFVGGLNSWNSLVQNPFGTFITKTFRGMLWIFAGTVLMWCIRSYPKMKLLLTSIMLSSVIYAFYNIGYSLQPIKQS